VTKDGLAGLSKTLAHQRKSVAQTQTFPTQFTDQEQILSTIVRAYCVTQYDWRL